jgi:hypothetical protein
VTIVTLQADLSLQSNATTMLPLQMVQTVELLPGKGNDFAASMKEDYLPAYKKAGVKDYWVFNTNGGGPGGERTLVRPIAKYADLDKPALLAQAGLSQEQQDKIGARRNATLASGIRTDVYRFIPELSYGVPSAPPPRATN